MGIHKAGINVQARSVHHALVRSSGELGRDLGNFAVFHADIRLVGRGVYRIVNSAVFNKHNSSSRKVLCMPLYYSHLPDL